jgi:hypothetical protein
MALTAVESAFRPVVGLLMAACRATMSLACALSAVMRAVRSASSSAREAPGDGLPIDTQSIRK